MKNKIGLLLMLIGTYSGSVSLSAVVLANEQISKPSIAEHTQQERLKNRVSQAISQFEQTPLAEWSYHVSRYENEEGDISSSSEQFTPNPARVGQWSLLEINGGKPTEKQARKFTDSKSNKHSGGITLKLRELIQLDSLQHHFESEGSLHAEFNVHLDKLGDKASKQLKGSLKFNKTQQFIEVIEIINIAPFSPAFSAKISDFKLALSFYKIDNAILPHQQSLNMKGNFAFFTEIDEKSIDTYSNYQYIGQLEPAN
ncbi:MAG: hypothetical protein ABJH28_18950 [Paraglaciecola sp.]|uniref:hypothetical protein n=1 Tax=Paraglaciecola sp. TaxID=1920173 RepID=UPI0032642D98